MCLEAAGGSPWPEILEGQAGAAVLNNLPGEEDNVNDEEEDEVYEEAEEDKVNQSSLLAGITGWRGRPPR